MPSELRDACVNLTARHVSFCCSRNIHVAPNALRRSLGHSSLILSPPPPTPTPPVLPHSTASFPPRTISLLRHGQRRRRELRRTPVKMLGHAVAGWTAGGVVGFPMHPDEAAAMGSTRGWCQGLGIVAGVFFSLPDLAEREAATAVGGLRGDDPGAAAPDGPGAATILVGATGWRCAHGGGRVLPARLLRRGMPRGYLPSSRSSSTACSPAPRRRASRPPALLEDLHATLTCRAPPRSWPGFFYKLLVDPHEVPSGEASCFLLSPEAVRRR